MLSFLKKRLLQLIFVLFLLSLATFTLMKLAPGDPVQHILRSDELSVTELDKEKLRNELGFQEPYLYQYGKWLWGIIQLDLGVSYLTGEPVTAELIKRLPTTMLLAAGGLCFALVLAIPLAIIAAAFPNRWPDHLCRMIALLAASIPSFWLGLLLIFLMATKFQLLPAMGTGTFAHFLLPSMTLGFSMAAIYMRLLRAGLLESLSQDYIAAARARGIKERHVWIRHAFRAALLPVLTMLGLSLGSLLGGAVVVEMLYSWPGLGSMVIDAIFRRDYPIIQGYVLVTGVFVVVVNLMVDLSYRVVDPRIRLGREGL